ncbi:MAG: HAD family phosphatase [Proteobacteria bacterium]|nr:HAD family phosphatase [Pseudomonadota bacterium]
MKHAPDALLFDLGNVLLEIDFGRALAHWSAFSALSPDAVRAAFGPDEAYRQHERGTLPAAAYFEHLRKVLRLEATDAQIEAGWNAIFVGEISATVDALRHARQPRHILTNSNRTHHACWRARFAPTLAGFGRIFDSSAMGYRKPEQEAFAHVARELGVTPGAILFFDDLEENVEGARRAGLQAVHVRSPQDVRDALERLG